MQFLSHITPKKAREQQIELAKKLVLTGGPENIKIVAGVDVAFFKKPPTGFCAVSLFKYPEMEYLKSYTELDIIGYPYIPGLLSYREGDLILETIKKVKENVDVYLFDGQGIAHPRGFGLASHMGLLIDKPSIGCAKNWFYGEYKEPDNYKGAKSDLKDENGKNIGTVLRTRDETNPVFVSPGHKIGIKEANNIVLNCATEYRIPEPLRKADQEAERYMKEGDV